MKRPEPYEHITVELKDGKKISWPIGSVVRLAPAAVCQIAARILTLRKILSEEPMPAGLKRRLEQLAVSIPFEDKFLSGNSAKVYEALRDWGARVNDQDIF